MPSRILTLAAVALALSACASGRFVKPGATAQDWNQDSYECERDARGVAYSFGGGFVAVAEARRFAIKCMAARGWSYVQE